MTILPSTTRCRIALGCLLILAGCSKTNTTFIVNLPAHESKRTLKEVRAEGDSLRLSVVQDMAPVFVAKIEATVITGDVYLKPLLISSVVRQTDFVIDLSGQQFPRDWRDRLYWIESESGSSPLSSQNHREIRRSKISVK
ncbi:MAG: hypothetical protein U0984_11750 [Prosthecobacter sp.]|nr:hypothetical protein [Prosthecobacter sp.]